MAASFSAGAGVWSTHFIGMLGYDPGVVVGYDTRLTLLSLIAAILASVIALSFARWAVNSTMAAVAGIILGLGVATMHYVGMASIQFPGAFAWDRSLVVASVMIGCLLSAAAFVAFRHRELKYPNAVAATLLTAAIAGLHFTAMGAIVITPDGERPNLETGLPRLALATGIAALMLMILGFAVLALFADRMRRANRALRTSEAAYRLLAENTTDVIIRSDLDTTRRYVSPASFQVFGVSPDELIGTQPLDTVHPDDRPAYQRVLTDLIQGRIDGAITRQRYRHKDGRWVWIEASFKVTRSGDNADPTGYVASLRDVSDRMLAETALRISEERLALALDSGSDGLWDWDFTTGKVWFSDRWQTMLGYDPGEIEGHARSWMQLTHPDDVEKSRRSLRDHIESRSAVYECEQRMRTKSGAYTWFLSRGKIVTRNPAGEPQRIVGIHIDIAARKRAELQIEYLALHDALTGLPNRTLFRDRLDREMVSAERRGHVFAVLACDLDRFKSVNDSMGHPAGDSLLRKVAERLQAAIREGDTVARLGGDEFAIVLRGLDRPQNASTTAQHVIDAVKLPFDLDGRTVSVGISIGIAVGPQDGGDPEQLLKNADIALYRAKAAGRSTYRYYEPEMDVAMAARNALEMDVREAVRLGEFELFYQPTLNLETNATSGFEALMRWRTPDRGFVPPAEFIPLAEEIGLIVQLGAWALKEACHEAAKWPGDLMVAVNVSALQFAEPGLEHAVVAALSASGLPPHRLELEITESVLMGDAESAISCLHRLHGLGVHIALDDFGTGFSSLNYLRRFPFDKIKIDRSFISEIGDPDTAAIVRAIVGLAERLGASITAEGIEDEIQLAHVRREGCTHAQGYLMSKPLSASDALQFAYVSRKQAAA
ncbi:EAL domain-containing protein [Methylobacterium sp. 77]|uniref:bifunctional diguanylate cyclase/phosphodiesterase n=1 Tax=Methylobacterium sp. 77 TaxID=1101192 RepID=UPI0024731969|nr:EAL domain-containing protein [Methylobacterium sp. 77]